MSTEPVRIGFVGCGFIADFHAMLLAQCKHPHQISAAYDIDRPRRDRFSEKWESLPVESLDAVLECVDAVFICTWTSEHRRLVEAAAKAGVHVFCEKPLAFDCAQAIAMTDCVERANIVNMVGLVLRSTPAMLALREMIHDPTSGRVMNIVFRDDQYLPTQGMYASDWRADPKRAGRGSLIEHSIHDLDILEWLVGPVQSVAAREAFFHGIQDIEDSVTALLAFAGGATATLSSVWHDILSRPSQRRIEIFCERALYVLEGEWFGPIRWEKRVGGSDERGSLDGEALTNWLNDRDIQIGYPHDRFLQAIQSGGTAAPNFKDAIRAHQLVDAAYASAANNGMPVDVSERMSK